jgi:hypothetical protein
VIDTETAETGLEALSVAITVLLEDAHGRAVTRLPASAAARTKQISALQAVGADVASLADAMEVLQRRREPLAKARRPSRFRGR